MASLQGALVVALVAAFLLPGLGASGLLDPWEMDRAAVARRIAGSPQVLVIDVDSGLLTPLQEAFGTGLSLRRIDGAGKRGARQALGSAAGELKQQITHALVLDVVAAVDGREGDALVPAVRNLDEIMDQNRGIAIIAVAPQEQHDALRQALARGMVERDRATAEAERLRKEAEARKAAGLEPEKDAAKDKKEADKKDADKKAKKDQDEADVEAPARLQRWHWTTPEQAAATLGEHCPSPWSRIQHKVDGFAVQAPWLDTVLVAASLSVFGPSEGAARLPGAAIALLIGLLLFIAMSRLRGTAAGWLTVLVYATLPLTLGAARLVTLEQSATLGVALVGLGLALGVTRRGLWWGAWVGLGLMILFLGRGLGGLSMGVAMAAGVALTVGWRRRGIAAIACGSLMALGAAAWIVLSDDHSPLLRSFRFTRMPFAGGLPDDQRDFSALVGQLGFGLYPWGPIFLLGIGRRLFEASEGERDDGLGAALVMGFGAPLLIGMALLPGFHHVVAPVSAMVAAICGLLLVDVLAGRVSGALIALLVAVPALLLHREIGKQASTMLRFVAHDPPFGDGRGSQIWPGELGLPRGLRAVVLLAVFAFAFGLARPVATVRRVIGRLQGVTAAAWALATVAILWALDAVISLGTRVDVLLGAQASRTGYGYDRVWATIQGTRPEVVAAATLFAVGLLVALLITIGRSRDWHKARVVRLFADICWPMGLTVVALLVTAAAAIGVLISGAMVAVDVRAIGWGEALMSGGASAAFWLPMGTALLALVLTLAVRLLSSRWRLLDAAGPGLWSRLLAAISRTPALSVGMPVLVGVAGLGIGASQIAGTWSYGFLAACWCLVIAVGMTIAGRSRGDLSGWAAALIAVAITAWGTIFTVLAARYVAEGQDGWDYLSRVLLTAPDAALLLLLLVGLAINRVALGVPLIDALRSWALWLAGRVERPRWAVSLLVVAGIVLSGGYAWTLLPGLSLHFSQKHLVARVAEAGGAADDDSGLPRTFKYIAGGRGGVQNNFYTQNMPTLSDREALIKVLAGRNAAARVTDFGPSGGSATLAIPGWNPINDKDKDGKRDAPAWFGITAAADGVKLKTRPPVPEGKVGWTDGQWKGAKLHGAGRPVEVLESDEDSLTLARPTRFVADDVRRGAFSLDRLERRDADPEASAMAAITRFVVLPKTLFSGVNKAFRSANDGRHIALLDARSSRLVLAASNLTAGQPDQNWLRKAILDEADYNVLEGLNRISVDFDGQMELIGWRLAEASVRRSQKYKLDLYFRVHKSPTRSYMMFMHPHPLHRDLWPHDWYTGGKKDAKRCTGCFQTDHWLAGDIVHMPVEQEVPLGTSSGAHDIILGWYNPLTDKRVPIRAASGKGVRKHGDNRVVVGRLQVR